MLHMLQCLYTYVASVYPQCFIYFLYTYVASFHTHVSSVLSIFFCMLQLLHLDVSKVDQDVTLVAMMFQLYITNVLSVFDVCYKGFIWMLQK